MVSNVAGYSRLKGLFRSGVNFKSYEAIVEGTKNAVVGNLPAEIINTIKLNTPHNVGAQVQQIQKGFGEASNVLREYDTLTLNKCKAAKLSDELICKIFESNIKEDVKGLETLKGEIENIFLPSQTESKNLLDKAAQEIRNAMREILPKGTTVSVSQVGAGNYGTGFKVEFSGKDGEKIFPTKILKVYRNEGLTGQIRLAQSEAVAQGFTSINLKALLKIAEGPAMTKNTSPIEFLNSKRTEFTEAFERQKKYLQHIFSEEHEQISRQLHGAAAEANSATFIKNAAGHSLNKTNVVNPDMFDLKNRFSISPMAGDEGLQPITSQIDFKRLGLKHGDVAENEANTVAGRIIDFGGISAKNEALLDGTVLKYYKKIMNRQNPNERLEVYNRLNELAQNPRTPLRDKIQKAVDIAKEEIESKKEPSANNESFATFLRNFLMSNENSPKDSNILKKGELKEKPLSKNIFKRGTNKNTITKFDINKIDDVDNKNNFFQKIKHRSLFIKKN